MSGETGGKILVVDDDAKLRSLLREYLESYGFQVETWPEGVGVEKAIAGFSPDLIVLDIMLPGKSGLEVLREIRSGESVPIIMLTAKGEDADRIVGLEMGADDYLPKPFNPRELVARIKVVLRRAAAPAPASTAAQPEAQRIESGGLALDLARRSLWVEEAEIPLSATEFKILRAMMRRPDTVFSRDSLLNSARGREAEAFDRAIDVHISNLRQKLKPHPKGKGRIKTVWGTGYMFVSLP